MSVAVALTVKNEEHSIRQLLDRLFAQTHRPDEVLIADGGSSDRTLEHVEEYRRRGYPVKALSAPGACRGRGRNLAIEASGTELIALIDGGCYPDPAWLEQLLAVLHGAPDTDAVFGVIQPITGTLFTSCASTAVLPALRLPDGRKVMTHSVASLLIRRKVWVQIGGFIEGFRTGEDLRFVQRIRTGGCSVGLAPEAIVHWQIPRTWRGTFHRLANYSQYSLEAGLGHTWHYRAFLYYAGALALLLAGVLRSPWWLLLLGGLMALRVIKTIQGNEKEQRGLRAFTPARLLMVGWVLLTMDLATLSGTWRWVRKFGRTGPSAEAHAANL